MGKFTVKAGDKPVIKKQPLNEPILEQKVEPTVITQVVEKAVIDPDFLQEFKRFQADLKKIRITGDARSQEVNKELRNINERLTMLDVQSEKIEHTQEQVNIFQQEVMDLIDEEVNTNLQSRKNVSRAIHKLNDTSEKSMMVLDLHTDNLKKQELEVKKIQSKYNWQLGINILLLIGIITISMIGS